MAKIKKVVNWIRKYGIKLSWKKLTCNYKEPNKNYEEWLEAFRKEELKKMKASGDKEADDIRISIAVPIYNTPEKYLREMIESVQNQFYSNWELCLADGSANDDAYQIILKYAQRDSRIQVKKLESNLGISGNTNEAIRMCTGEYIGLLDHDDILEESALYNIKCAIAQGNHPDIIYTDEDKISMNGDSFFDPHFKSGYNRELLRSNNYICHFFLAKRDIIGQVGGYRKEYDGAQDYDMILRCTELAEHIVHIAKPLYHWRCHKESTAENPESKLYAYESGKRAIEDHLHRTGEEAMVEYTDYWGFYHVQYKVKSQDLVTIVLMNQYRPKKHIKKCVSSIKKTIGYANYEIIVIDEGQDLKIERISGKYVLFVDSQIKMISKNWMPELLGMCQRKDVGAVGIKLYNKDETIKHAGIIEGMQGYAFEGFPRVMPGYFHRDDLVQNVSGVTTKFIMMSKEIVQYLQRINCNLSNEIVVCREIWEQKKEVVMEPNIEAYIMGDFQKREDIKRRKDIFYNENLELKAPGYRIKKD